MSNHKLELLLSLFCVLFHETEAQSAGVKFCLARLESLEKLEALRDQLDQIIHCESTSEKGRQIIQQLLPAKQHLRAMTTKESCSIRDELARIETQHEHLAATLERLAHELPPIRDDSKEP